MKKILVIVPFAMSEDNRELRRQQLDSLSLPPGVHFEYRSVKAGPVNYASHHDFVLADVSIFEAGCRAEQGVDAQRFDVGGELLHHHHGQPLETLV